MVRVLIPNHLECHSRSGQPYTVYCIEVYYHGKCTKLQRRYRDFYELNKALRKEMHTPEFPPKKVRNLSTKLIEQRRQGLQAYLQGVVRDGCVPLILVDFLGLPEEAAYAPHILETGGLESSDELDELSHQSLIGFNSQPDRFPFNLAATGSAPQSTSHVTSAGPTNGAAVASPSVQHSRNSSGSSLADVVLKGALDAFYSTNDEDFFYQGV